jgi:hypothetical protein
MYVLSSKVFDKWQDNAFVMITLPLGKKTKAEAYEITKEFINAFYPHFLEYITENPM